MKFKIISLLLILNIGAWITPQKVSAQGATVSFQIFYDDLSPYGTWVNSPKYGYAWRPRVAVGFRPYSTNGHWVFTDQGWTWVSNYSWGWAPFHYGRWYSDPTYGAMWVPDNEWGPGWVTWRSSGDYYGWAPMEPGVSINVAYSNEYNIPNNRWRFVRCKDFGRTDISNYYVNSSNNITIIKNTTVINNIRVDKVHNVTFNGGPDKMEVEKRGGKPVNSYTIKESNKPGQSLSNNQLQIYRPAVQKNNGNGPKPAPTKVTTVKGPSQKANQPVKPQSPTPQKANQPVKQQAPMQKVNQPVKQQAPMQKVNQPVKQQAPMQKVNQPVKQQQAPMQKTNQPVKRQPSHTQKANGHQK